MTSAQPRYEEAEEEDNAAVLHIGAIFIEIYRFLPAVRFGNILNRKSVFCTSQLSDSHFKNEPFHTLIMGQKCASSPPQTCGQRHQ